MTVPAQFLVFSSPTLLRIARKAALDSSKDSALALVAIVFSVFAVEAFTNELLDYIHQARPDACSKEMSTLQKMIDAARLQERYASLRTKLDVIAVCLSGTRLNFGTPPLQDLFELLGLRNDLVHSRPEPLATEPALTDDGTPTDHQVHLRKGADFLVSLGLVNPAPNKVLTPLLSVIQSDRVACWAHNAAIATLRLILELLPSEGWRAKASFALQLDDLPLAPLPAA